MMNLLDSATLPFPGIARSVLCVWLHHPALVLGVGSSNLNLNIYLIDKESQLHSEMLVLFSIQCVLNYISSTAPTM